jgi:hypothetical protein
MCGAHRQGPRGASPSVDLRAASGPHQRVVRGQVTMRQRNRAYSLIRPAHAVLLGRREHERGQDVDAADACARPARSGVSAAVHAAAHVVVRATMRTHTSWLVRLGDGLEVQRAEAAREGQVARGREQTRVRRPPQELHAVSAARATHCTRTSIDPHARAARRPQRERARRTSVSEGGGG